MNASKTSFPINYLTLMWSITFLKLLYCLVWLNKLLKTPTAPMYWFKLTGISSGEKLNNLGLAMNSNEYIVRKNNN